MVTWLLRDVGSVHRDDCTVIDVYVPLCLIVSCKKTNTQSHTNCAEQTLIKFVFITLLLLLLLLSLLFSCSSTVKTNEESNNSGRGKQAHSKVWGHREPSPHLQMVQRWQRAEEKQKSPNKEQPVSTSHPCPVKPDINSVRWKETEALQSKARLLL